MCWAKINFKYKDTDDNIDYIKSKHMEKAISCKHQSVDNIKKQNTFQREKWKILNDKRINL